MTLLIELAVKSTVIAGAALILLALLRRRSAAERSWMAHAALAVLAALPAAVLLLPRWRLLPPVESSPAPAALSASLEAASRISAPAIDPALWLQGLYVGGAALMLLATGIAIVRLAVLRRGATVLADPDWLSALALAKTRMRVRSGAALLVSTALTSPVSWGLIKPTIVVNAGLVASKADAEAVIAHELAHVVRRDWAKLIGARLVTALFWFNPLVWALARQCHQLREEAADDAVLGAEVSSADYASLLVEAARRQGRSLAAVHGVTPGKGSLHRRVSRVLDAAARRTPTPAAWALSVAFGAALFAGPLAAVTLEPEKAAPEAETTVATPRATAEPVATTAKASTRATVSRPALTVAGKLGGRASPAATVTTHAKGATPSATTVTAAAIPKDRLTPGAPAARPAVTISKTRPAAMQVETAAPYAPKVAIVASPPRRTATASGSASQTLTKNGKTLRVEIAYPELGDWQVDDADWREAQRDRFEAERDRREAERDRLEDERDRLEDEKDRRADEAERLRDQRAERDKAAALAERMSQATIRAAERATARAAERSAAAAERAQRKAAATPTPPLF